MRPIIKAENIGKQYRIGPRQASYQTLRESLTSAFRAPLNWLQQTGKPGDDIIWALKDVSFDVMPGEVVGIIGRNGAGKSTLLKILSRITEPTTGQVDLYGRVGSLLEVGTGFHGELTGRENIYLSGAILGMRKLDIVRRFDEIVAFSELEKFIDTPVKHYSSGMYMRLAFAVAAHLDPEILVIDEVLAVGDAEFQKKCIGKMSKVAQAGRTVLFVSHNMTAVQSLCSRAIFLDGGVKIEEGDTPKIVSLYLKQAARGIYEQTWDDPATAPGNDQVRIRCARVIPEDGSSIYDITVNTALRLEFEYWNYVDRAELNLSLVLYTQEGICAFNSVSPAMNMSSGVVKSSCYIPSRLLNDGVYRVALLFVRDTSKVIFTHDEILNIKVHDEKRDVSWYGKWIGVLRPQLSWDHTCRISTASGSRISTASGSERGSHN